MSVKSPTYYNTLFTKKRQDIFINLYNKLFFIRGFVVIFFNNAQTVFVNCNFFNFCNNFVCKSLIGLKFSLNRFFTLRNSLLIVREPRSCFRKNSILKSEFENGTFGFGSRFSLHSWHGLFQGRLVRPYLDIQR